MYSNITERRREYTQIFEEGLILIMPLPTRIFVTGGSGVLGEALLEALSTEKVIALRHRQGFESAGVEAVSGSIAEARLGLADDDHARIVNDTETIVHCASLTQFVGGERRIWETNVEGTRQVLSLARAANAPIYYISTAFINPHASRAEDQNAYIASKREAERLLKASGHPLTIIRPSIISGDSRTGYIPRHQGYHALLRLLLREALPVLPIDQSSYVDVIPRDIVAQFIAAIVRKNLVGKEFWLTLGRGRAPSAHRLMEQLQTIVRDMTGKSLMPPKFVSTEMYERLIKPAILPSLPPQLIKDFNRLEKLEGYFSLAEPLPSSLDELAERGIGIEHCAYAAFESNVRWLIADGSQAPFAGAPTLPAISSAGAFHA
jgi:nucleoside-diphosphate-sugar epimerase